MKPGLQGVDLSVRRGTVLGVTGARRSGKSSLAHCLARWSWPTCGEIERLTDVQLVPQYGPPMFDLRFKGPDKIEELPAKGPRVRRKAVQDALDTVALTRADIEDYGRDVRVRLSIALALATLDTQPGTLILDEVLERWPMQAQLELLRSLRRVQRRQDLTVILISRDMPLLAEVADEVCLMEEGRVADFLTARAQN